MTVELVSKKKEVLKNKLFGLLCEREEDGSWENFLDNILMELIDFGGETESYNHYVLIAKLTACRYLSYKYYRKTIFECMEIIDRTDVI